MISFSGMSTEYARVIQAGGFDAHGHLPEVTESDGDGNPCRHCLEDITAGEAMLILAHRPFAGLNPYAETGPVFLHSRVCNRWDEQTDCVPSIFVSPSRYIVRGYDRRERIVYGTGRIVDRHELLDYAEQMFKDARVAFGHVRSSTNNCWQARLDRK